MSALNLRQLSDNLLRLFFVLLCGHSNLCLHHPFKVLYVCRIELRGLHVIIERLHVGYLLLETPDHLCQLLYHHAYLAHLFVGLPLHLVNFDTGLSL